MILYQNVVQVLIGFLAILLFLLEQQIELIDVIVGVMFTGGLNI